MSVIYKILFEVRVLHEYYLTQANGDSIFNIANQNDRIAFIENRFLQDDRSINSELSFSLPDSLKTIFDNYHLRLLPVYSGCKVAIEVKRQTFGDGTVVYKPKVALPADLNILLGLTKVNESPDGFTNSKLRKASNAAYYLSNENIPGIKTFPSLSNPISPFNASAVYEQGEPALFGPNDIREFYVDKDGNNQFLNVAGTGFVNENDRNLFPLSFFYTFTPTENVTEANVVVKNKDGNPIVISRDQYGIAKSLLQFKSNRPLTKIRLDFSRSDAASLPRTAISDNLVYSLEITDNNSITRKTPVVFYDEGLARQNNWALINIKPAVTNAAFNLLDGTGFLITRINPDTTIAPPPIFEIRVKSRLSYWRYIHDKKKKLKNDHLDFLFEQGDNLVSLVPRPLTYSFTLFKKPDNSLHYLPNPQPFDTLRVEGDKVYADIVVPESNLFPLQP